MASATICMALYNVYARRYIARSSPFGFLAYGMAVGGGALVVFCLLSGRAAAVLEFSAVQTMTGLYLAAGGGALGFYLWVLALKHASPTRVANTITINPLIAMIAGVVLLDEPVTRTLALGLVAVFAGVWVATAEGWPLRS